MLAKTKKYSLILAGLLVLCMLSTLPVAATNGTISIGYRGSGSAYVGDTLVFDGKNTAGTGLLIRITGPNLPAEGVPVNDLNGAPGSGTPVAANPDGTWRFAWYTANMRGSDKIITARYTITAYDAVNPEILSTTSVFLRKPEFSVRVSPDTITRGEYVQITGIAQNNVKEVRFEITDATGRVTNAYDTTVSGTGYFNKGIHADLPPGSYTITMTSPSVRTTARTSLAVTGTGGEAANGSADHGTTTAPGTDTPGTGSGSLAVTSNPSGASVFINGVMLGITPYSVDMLSPGTYLVEVKAPGYTTTTMTVEVLAGQTTTIGPSLVKGSGAAPISLPTLIGGAAISIAILAALGRRRG